jgi:5-methylcytosine-specific restriction endonuclease McrA
MVAKRTLLLSSWFFPLKVVRWQDAVTMLYLEKVDRVVDYDDEIRSPSLTMHTPAVIRLRRSVRRVKCSVKFSRVNVFTRDCWRCQYCGQRFPMDRLTYDHVRTRSAGGRTEWTNIVTACRSCNARKRNRTPDESGMFPIQPAREPRSLPITAPDIDVTRAPVEWRDFLVVSV